MPNNYEGFYATFQTYSKKDYAILSGADTLVGDRYTIEFAQENGNTVATVSNKFGYKIGYFEAADSRKLQLAYARDWKINVLLSFIAYTDSPDPGHYWGQMAVIAYAPDVAEAFDVFADKVADALADGIRPEIDLSQNSYNEVLRHEGDWLTNGRVPLPKTKKGMAIIKSKRSSSERMVEQGRNGNKGCYAVSIAFIVIVVAVIVGIILHFAGLL